MILMTFFQIDFKDVELFEYCWCPFSSQVVKEEEEEAGNGTQVKVYSTHAQPFQINTSCKFINNHYMKINSTYHL